MFALLESVWNLLQNPYNNTYLTLGRLLHYLGKLKSHFCRYSTDVEENANKVRFKFTDLILLCVTLCWVYLCVNKIFKIFSIQRLVIFLVKCGWLWKEPVVVWAFFGSVNSLLATSFVQLSSENSSVNLFAVYLFECNFFIKILSSSLNTTLIVDKHCSDICSVCCDEFLEPQVDRKSK